MKTSYNKRLEATSRGSTREVIIEAKDGKPSPREVPKIWRVNPSYTHTNSTISIARIILIVAMGTFFTGVMYLLSLSLQVSISIGIAVIIGFIFVFYDYIMLLNTFFKVFHELKTPLIAIKGFSNLLSKFHREDLNEDILSMLSEIENGCSRFEGIIRKIIESSKLESSKLKLQTSEEDLSFLIKFCLNELNSFSEMRNHTIDIDIEDKIMVYFNKEQIYEVVSNLLSNAIKYTPPNGVIKIKAEITDQAVIVKIQDSGIGFTEKEKRLVFQQFGKIERYGQGYDLETDGSGLGLYISKKIVESHGGEIWFESKGRYKGSTFCFALPA